MEIFKQKGGLFFKPPLNLGVVSSLTDENETNFLNTYLVSAIRQRQQIDRSVIRCGASSTHRPLRTQVALSRDRQTTLHSSDIEH
jgi:hypothetical protein